MEVKEFGKKLRKFYTCTNYCTFYKPLISPIKKKNYYQTAYCIWPYRQPTESLMPLLTSALFQSFSFILQFNFKSISNLKHLTSSEVQMWWAILTRAFVPMCIYLLCSMLMHNNFKRVKNTIMKLIFHQRINIIWVSELKSISNVVLWVLI